MANFEGLIRQALASQNASDPAVRQRVYQSSRNALYRMLEKTGKTDDAVVAAQSERLENSIAAIEAEYTPPAPADPVSAPEPKPEPQDPIAAPPQEPAPPTQEEPVPTPAQHPLPESVAAPESAPVTPPAPAPAPLPPENLEIPQTETAPVLGDTNAAGPSSAPSPVSGLPPDYTPEPMFPPVGEPAPVETPAPNPPEQNFGTAGIDTQLPPQPEAPAPQESAPPVDQFAEVGQVPDYGSAAAPRLPDDPQATPATATGVTGQAEPVLDDFAMGNGSTTADDFVAKREPGPVYKRRNPLLRRIWPIALALAVLLVILWIMYALFAMNNGEPGTGANNDAVSGSPEDGTIITLLRPTDLSALVTAGRGTAEIVSELNQQMLRLKSVRQGTASGGNAEPILLELERGVLRQIAGKEVTVEFYSKSGGSGPAQFAVQCDIGGDSACGRKRFRVGLQPERSIFSLDIPPNVSTDDPAYLAINTDVTNAADSSGSGDVIDIIHVRLILDE